MPPLSRGRRATLAARAGGPGRGGLNEFNFNPAGTRQHLQNMVDGASHTSVDPANSPLETALARLSQAIGRLEATAQRRLEADASVDGLQDELQRLGEDRSQLAATLDTAEARVARLEDANREVSRRLVSAMESIRSVLETHGG